MQDLSNPQQNSQLSGESKFAKLREHTTRLKLGAFIVLFAAIGAYFIFSSSASPQNLANLDVYQMSLPHSAVVYTSNSAPVSQAVGFNKNGSATGTLTVPSGATLSSLSLTAASYQCKGAPTLSIRLNQLVALPATSITSGNWTSYSANLNLGSGTYKVKLVAGNIRDSSNCLRTVRADLIAFNGSENAPAPIITFNANPASVIANDASGLSWSTTNATSCSLSGSLSENNLATSGSLSTGVLTLPNGQSSGVNNYTLTCIDNQGGNPTSTNSSTSININSATDGPDSVYWGDWAHDLDLANPAAITAANNPNDSFDAPWDMATQDKFETDAGKTASMMEFGYTITANDYGVDTTALNNIWNHGSIPFYNLSTGSYTDEAVASGTVDTQLIKQAQTIAAWKHPIFIRFDWEMNGNWFDWGTGNGNPNNNTPAQYVAMWQHVHQIFADNGATNVTWAWIPNIDPSNQFTPLSQLYPGDSYVDWTGFDAYSANQTFTLMAASTYDNILEIAPTKPMVIAETGGSEVTTNPTKASYITDLLTKQIPDNYPAIKAVMWFESEAPGPDCSTPDLCWYIESDPSAQAAFKAGIAGSEYIPAGNQPTSSPIAAP